MCGEHRRKVLAEIAETLTGVRQLISVRPERVRLTAADALTDGIGIGGTVAETVYTGPTTRYIVDGDGGVRLIAERQNDHHPSAATPFGRGDRVRVSWTADHAALIP